MDFIIGGSYQGKLDYVKEKYNLAQEDVFTCRNDSDIKPGKRVIYHFERYVEYCLKNGIEVNTDFPGGSIVIMDDIFCGVVPVDKDVRALRESCGRAGTKLSSKADKVVRIFCGLPLVLKGK